MWGGPWGHVISTWSLVGRFARIDSRFEKTFFCEWTSQNMGGSEDWTRVTRISMRIGELTRFGRIWPSASKIEFFCKSIRANLQNVGVRIACPLRPGPYKKQPPPQAKKSQQKKKGKKHPKRCFSVATENFLGSVLWKTQFSRIGP